MITDAPSVEFSFIVDDEPRTEDPVTFASIVVVSQVPPRAKSSPKTVPAFIILPVTNTESSFMTIS